MKDKEIENKDKNQIKYRYFCSYFDKNRDKSKVGIKKFFYISKKPKSY